MLYSSIVLTDGENLSRCAAREQESGRRAGSESARIGGDDEDGDRHETIAIEKTDKVCPLCEDRAAKPCLIVGGRLAV
jgi:hypothetical protein